jgi:ankyrin repeat protein
MAAAGEAERQAVISAAKRGVLEEVRRLVQQDHQLLEAYCDLWTPLMAAAEGGRVEVVRYLLDEGAEINRRPVEWSALEVACFQGRSEVVMLLLARGADTSPSHSGWTPFMAASIRGDADICNILLAHGCGDIDQPCSRYGRTALHLASLYGHVGVVRVLLGAWTDPLMVDQWGRTPLSLAIVNTQAECVALLQVGNFVLSRLALLM